MLGYYAGPEVHIVDRGALCDPILARLPARFFPDWRIGHYWRVLPGGYLGEVLAEKPQLADPNLRELVELVFQASRAPIMQTGRWRAVWSLGTGDQAHLIEQDAYRLPGIKHANLRSYPENNLRWSDDRGVDITGVGIEFSARNLFFADSIELVLTSRDWRTIEIGTVHWRREIEADSRQCVEAGGLFTCRLSLPRTMARREASYVRVFPTIDLRPPGDRSPRQVIKSVRIEN
jgi:arabinofuranosyltransferase